LLFWAVVAIKRVMAKRAVRLNPQSEVPAFAPLTVKLDAIDTKDEGSRATAPRLPATDRETRPRRAGQWVCLVGAGGWAGIASPHRWHHGQQLHGSAGDFLSRVGDSQPAGMAGAPHLGLAASQMEYVMVPSIAAAGYSAVCRPSQNGGGAGGRDRAPAGRTHYYPPRPTVRVAARSLSLMYPALEAASSIVRWITDLANRAGPVMTGGDAGRKEPGGLREAGWSATVRTACGRG